jgi:hypothetical protein
LERKDNWNPGKILFIAKAKSALGRLMRLPLVGSLTLFGIIPIVRSPVSIPHEKKSAVSNSFLVLFALYQ